MWTIIDSKKLHFSTYSKGDANIMRIIEQKVVGTKNISGVGLIEVPPKGIFPLHTHPEREEVYYVLAGSGHILVEDQEIPATEGLTFYVSGETAHGMKNPGNLPFKVLYITTYV